MSRIVLVPAALLTLLLSACSTGGGSNGGGSKPPRPPVPATTGAVRISNTIVVQGRTQDYGMKLVDGSGLDGTGNEDENQEAPFELRKGGILKNAVAKDWPESVHIKGDNTLVENIYIPNVGEDAVSMFAGTKNLTIRGCTFIGAPDKLIQLNGGSNILIEDCYFEDFGSAIRVRKGIKGITLKNCTFVNGKRAIVFDEGESTSELKQSGNKFYNVSEEIHN